MSLPNALTSAAVPFPDAIFPAALSDALALSRMAKMFASLSGAGAGVAAAAAFAALSAAAAESAFASPFEHAATNAHAPSSVIPLVNCIMVPPERLDRECMQ